MLGNLFLFYLLWRTQMLAPGRFFARPARESRPAARQNQTAVPPPRAAAPPVAAPKAPPEPPKSPFEPPQPGAAQPAPSAPDPLATLASPLTDEERLKRKNLGMPIAGLDRSSILDTFNETRGGPRKHEATDILAPRGAPVLAVDSGVVKKLFTSQEGGLTVYQFDSEENFCYYYAHLDHYAEGLREGMYLQKGDRVGYVGTTGNAPPGTPHLHLAIFRLGPEKRWWQGTPINPYPILMAIP